MGFVADQVAMGAEFSSSIGFSSGQL
jgi:hypothetical protein